jgi:hypothetical protein
MEFWKAAAKPTIESRYLGASSECQIADAYHESILGAAAQSIESADHLQPNRVEPLRCAFG